MRAASPLAAPILCLVLSFSACSRSGAPPASTANGQSITYNGGKPSEASTNAKSASKETSVAAAPQALSATPQPSTNDAAGAVTTPPTANPSAPAAASSTESPESPKSGTEPPESDTGSTPRLIVRPLRFVPAQGTGFPPITVDQQGNVTWGDIETAKVVGNTIVFGNGNRAATWLDDDRIVVAGWAETFKLTRDDRIEGEQGLRIALDDRGLVSVADPAHRVPAHSIGRFERLNTEARPLAELVILIQQIRHPPIPADGAPASAKPPHLYVFHPTHPGEKSSKPATNKKKPAKKAPLPKKKPVAKKKR